MSHNFCYTWKYVYLKYIMTENEIHVQQERNTRRQEV